MHGAKASNAVPAAIDNKPTPYSLGLSGREDYSVFGKLTRLFVKVLISWISRRRSAPHSHRQRERERESKSPTSSAEPTTMKSLIDCSTKPSLSTGTRTAESTSCLSQLFRSHSVTDLLSSFSICVTNSPTNVDFDCDSCREM